MKPDYPTDQTYGKIFGITGLVTSLIPGGWFAGLIFSILGYKLSKKAGVDNKPAVIGIWISSIFLALLLIGFLVVAALAYFDNQNKARDTDTLVSVSLVRSTSAAYAVENDTYPDLSELKSADPFDHLPERYEEPKLVGSSTPEEGQIGYVECRDDGQAAGAEIYYYSHQDGAAKLADSIGDC